MLHGQCSVCPATFELHSLRPTTTSCPPPPLAAAARKALAEAKGEAALLPHNLSYSMAGDVEKALDPYFPFAAAVDVWARTFAALGITYRGATMRLDLLDREGKYRCVCEV